MKMTITFLLIFTFELLKAPSFTVGYVARPEVIAPYEKLWQAVCQVESSGDPFAIGDRHLKNKSYGISQIRQSRLDDYYNRTGIRYSVTDMFDTVKSKQVFMHYASGDYEKVARAWNAGPNWKKVKISENYYLKIQKTLLSL